MPPLVITPGATYDTSGTNLPDASIREKYLPQERRDALASFTNEPIYTPTVDLQVGSVSAETWEEKFEEGQMRLLSMLKVYFDATNVS